MGQWRTAVGKLGKMGQTLLPAPKPGSVCLTDETETRTELIGEWLDPVGLHVHSNISTQETDSETEDVFQSHVKLWVRSVADWFQHDSSACVDVTTVRYEDIDRNLDIVGVLTKTFNSSVTNGATLTERIL